MGNGATNVVFPLTIICLAFSLMLGDGTSAYLSLKLGEKRKEEASKGVANGILLSIIVAITFCVVTLAFLPQLLKLFGCTEVVKDYALNYRNYIKLYNKSRWKSKICNDINDIRSSIKCNIRPNIYICI